MDSNLDPPYCQVTPRAGVDEDMNCFKFSLPQLTIAQWYKTPAIESETRVRFPGWSLARKKMNDRQRCDHKQDERITTIPKRQRRYRCDAEEENEEQDEDRSSLQDTNNEEKEEEGEEESQEEHEEDRRWMTRRRRRSSGRRKRMRGRRRRSSTRKKKIKVLNEKQGINTKTR